MRGAVGLGLEDDLKIAAIGLGQVVGEARHTIQMAAARGVLVFVLFGVFLKVVHRPHNQVLGVLGFARVLFQLEGLAHGDAAHVPAHTPALVVDGQRFHPHPRVMRAKRAVAVTGGVVIDLLVFLRMRPLGHRLDRGQIRLRLLKVIAVQGDLARGHRLGAAPAEDVILVQGGVVVGLAEGDGGMPGDRLVRPAAIGQHQLLGRAGMVEEEVDPFLLHQPAQEIIVGFAVLHAELSLLVGMRGLVGQIRGEAVLAQHLLYDLDHRLVLKDPAVLGAGQKPQPGADLGAVMRLPVMDAQKARFDAGAVDRPFRAVLLGHIDRQGLADDVAQVKVHIRRDELDRGLGDFAHAIAHTGASELHLGFGQRSLDTRNCRHSAVLSGIRPSPAPRYAWGWPMSSNS